jgi:hypothetical protein
MGVIGVDTGMYDREKLLKGGTAQRQAGFVGVRFRETTWLTDAVVAQGESRVVYAFTPNASLGAEGLISSTDPTKNKPPLDPHYPFPGLSSDFF